MDYQLTLEKAVLEYAGSAASRMKTMPDKFVQIPGYSDVHVWGMAARLNETGLLTALVPDNGQRVGITDINQSGSSRLTDLRAQATKFEADKSAKLDAEIAKNRQAKLDKKWWRRLIGKGNVSA